MNWIALCCKGLFLGSPKKAIAYHPISGAQSPGTIFTGLSIDFIVDYLPLYSSQ